MKNNMIYEFLEEIERDGKWWEGERKKEREDNMARWVMWSEGTYHAHKFQFDSSSSEILTHAACAWQYRVEWKF